jgi:GTP-binding protein
MAVPIVAIVGRPNAGKSSLFNALAGKRIAIVDPTAGVTRDRVSTLLKTEDHFFELVDTGGIGIQDHDNLTEHVEKQISMAIEEAAVIVFVVDVRSGPVPLDEEVAQRLRAANKPVLLVANKCDVPGFETHATDFFRLGYGAPLCVSAQQGRGKHQLLRAILKHLPRADGPTPALEPEMKLAIVGRRNTGKSTFINQLAKSERMIVSEVAGTTRDSVDVRFERDGKAFLAIDTAGVRHKGSIASDIEFYSMARAERSIRRADVVLLFLDASQKISRVDKQLADYVLKEHKPAIFAVNKWDLLTSAMPTGKFAEYVQKTFPMLDYVPMAFITAKDGKNVQAVLNLAQTLHKQSVERVSTGDLNRVLRQALNEQPPPMRQNRRPKVYYATQVAVQPPTIVLFTNGPELFDNTYQRYLLKTFRDRLPFNDIPIQMYLRAKSREEAGDEGEVPPEVTPKVKKPGKKATKPVVKEEPELWTDV